MPSKIVVNASGVDQDSLNWLLIAEDGHYFIEQQRNRAGSHAHCHPVSDEMAKKIMAANLLDAWSIMERYVASEM